MYELIRVIKKCLHMYSLIMVTNQTSFPDTQPHPSVSLTPFLCKYKVKYKYPY